MTTYYYCLLTIFLLLFGACKSSHINTSLPSTAKEASAKKGIVVTANALASQVGVAGVVKIEDGVTLWGQVVVNKTLTIGENAVLLGTSGVTHSLEGNKTYWGTPAQDAGLARRELVWIKRIPQLWDKVMNKAAIL